MKKLTRTKVESLVLMVTEYVKEFKPRDSNPSDIGFI
jgi:hypothetical protein